MTVTERELRVEVAHFVKGAPVLPDPDAAPGPGGLVAPDLMLDDVIWPRRQPGPAFDMPVGEIIDLLVETGRRLDLDSNPLLAEALERSVAVSPLGRRILTAAYRSLAAVFDRALLEFQVDTEIGRDRLDGWAEVTDPSGRVRRVRAFPPRLIHVLAGNTPGVTGITIARSALTKGVHLLKLPSNDPLTATAILRTMAEVAPDHPVVRSFCAAYWRGGDPVVEGALFRAQWFDKLVAWGGEAAIRSAISYVAPGFELVSFDPKVSLSLVGPEGLADDAALEESARRAAVDVALFNQSACASSRFVYIEADPDDPRFARWCERLAAELGVDRPLSDGAGVPVPPGVREEVEMCRTFPEDFSVSGDYEHGIVIGSADPVEFHPEGKVVNVVAVERIEDAFERVNVATQTIGIYPASSASEWRDLLAARGMQRIVPLGEVADHVPGMPHDGFYPLQRFVRWMVDDC